MVRQAPVICVMAPPIHLGVWSMGYGCRLIIDVKNKTVYILVCYVCMYLLKDSEVDETGSSQEAEWQTNHFRKEQVQREGGAE